MNRQQQAESRLLETYHQLVIGILMLMLLAFLISPSSYRLEKVTNLNLQLEHRRLLNVLAVIRSQWLSQGKPNHMPLIWLQTIPSHGERPNQRSTNNSSIVKITSGWPVPDEWSTSGCRNIWEKLLGFDANTAKITVNYHPHSYNCQFTLNQSNHISYQLSSGKVQLVSQ